MRLNELRFVIVVIALFFMSACQQEPSSAKEPLAPVVKVVSPHKIQAQTQQHLVGQIVPLSEVAIGFQVAGPIEQRLVKLGDFVDQGQLLFQLEPKDYQLKVQAVQAKIRATQSDLKTAQRDLLRLEDLRQRKLVSQQQVDNAQNAVTKLTAALAALQPELDLAKNQLAYTQLKAPFSGQVTAILADKGQITGIGTPVLKIANISEKLAQFYLPESLKLKLSTVPERLKIQVGKQTLVAKLYEQAPSADPLSRTWLVRYQFEKAVSNLPILGQTVYANFEPPQPATKHPTHPIWELPTTAILIKANQAYLFEVVDNHLKRIPIKVVKFLNQHAWVTGDLSPSMKIVRMGVQFLQDGTKVSVHQDE